MWIRDIEELGQEELQDFHTWWRIHYLALSVGDVGGSKVSEMQSSICGHGWRIARAAAVFLAAVLLAQANITKQPPRSWGRGM